MYIGHNKKKTLLRDLYQDCLKNKRYYAPIYHYQICKLPELISYMYYSILGSKYRLKKSSIGRAKITT